MQSRNNKCYAVVLLLAGVIGLSVARAGWAADKPNIVMLMTDDTGWGDFGAYSGGGWGLGHPTPHVDQIAKEGVYFTSWYGQASCTAGRASSEGAAYRWCGWLIAARALLIGAPADGCRYHSCSDA